LSSASTISTSIYGERSLLIMLVIALVVMCW